MSSTSRTRRPCFSSGTSAAGGAGVISAVLFSFFASRGSGVDALGGERGVSISGERISFSADISFGGEVSLLGTVSAKSYFS